MLEQPQQGTSGNSVASILLVQANHRFLGGVFAIVTTAQPQQAEPQDGRGVLAHEPIERIAITRGGGAKQVTVRRRLARLSHTFENPTFLGSGSSAHKYLTQAAILLHWRRKNSSAVGWHALQGRGGRT